MSQNIFLSNYSIAKLQDLAFGATAFTAPATLYAARFTAQPTAAGGGTEASYTGYSRVAVTNNSTNFPASASQEKHNGTSIQWGIALSAETHTGWGFYDASSGGNLIAVVTFPIAIAVAIGQIPFVAASAFSLTIKNTGAAIFPSNFLIAALLDHLFSATAYSPAATHYLARYTANPTAANASGTEAAYTSYARKSFTNNTTNWSNSASQTKKNGADIVPTAAGSGPTTITAWAIYDASTSGNELLVMISANPLVLVNGGTDDVPANAINWILSNS